MAIRSRRVALADDPIYKSGLIITSHHRSKESIKDSSRSQEKTEVEQCQKQEGQMIKGYDTEK